jgi:hypothetical protein
LPVFDLEVDAARRAQSGSSRQRGMESDAVIDVRERKEQYLRRLLVSVSIMQVRSFGYLFRVGLSAQR